MHRKEGDVHTDEEGSEVRLSEELAVANSSNLFTSVVVSGKDGEDSSHGQNVVKVGNNVVGVMKGDVQPRVCKDNAGNSTHGEEKDEAKGEQQRSAEVERAAPEGCESAKDFDTGWNGDDHRCRGKVGACIHVQTDGVHVMRSDDKSKEADGQHRVDHTEHTEDRFARGRFDDVADDSKSGKDKDVDLRVAEKPE